MRILCLDVGDKKIGISLSDPTGTVAQALKLHRRNSLTDDIKELKNLVEQHDVKKIVIGLPKNLNGTIGQRAQNVMAFADEIRRNIMAPVVLWDERFTTNEAHRVFDMAQVKQKKRKPFLDIIASQLILQGYLDAQKTC